MMQFDPSQYGPVLAPLLATDRDRPLGPGSPDGAVRPALEALSVDKAFGTESIKRRDMAACCISGVWLLYDFLDQSHSLSQNISTPEGSYWHGLMHRREPDYSNAKYWFRRVGEHAIFAPLAKAAAELASENRWSKTSAAESLAGTTAWDPFQFVDLCQSAARSAGADEDFCRAVARQEWELLFDYCYRHAIGQS